MIVRLKKECEDKSWELIDISKLAGISIIDFMTKKVFSVVAEVEIENCCLYILNDEKDLEMVEGIIKRKKKNKEITEGVIAYAEEMRVMLGTNVIPPVVLDVFPDASFQSHQPKII